MKNKLFIISLIIILLSFSFIACTAKVRETITPGLASTTTAIETVTTKEEEIITEQTTTTTLTCKTY